MPPYRWVNIICNTPEAPCILNTTTLKVRILYLRFVTHHSHGQVNITDWVEVRSWSGWTPWSCHSWSANSASVNKNSPHFMKFQCSWLSSQQSATFPCLGPDQYSPHPPNTRNVHFNIIIPSTPMSSRSRLPTKILHAFLFSTARATCPTQFILPDFVGRIIFVAKHKVWNSWLYSYYFYLLLLPTS